MWTDENVEILKACWAEGQSASVIAEKIGTARNAVIGKINRLKTPKRQTMQTIQRRHRTYAPGRTAAERAAQMKADGLSITQIASRLGWTISTARSMCSRGLRIDEFRQKHRDYQRRNFSKP